MRDALLALPLALAAVAAGCAGNASSAGNFAGEEQKVADRIEQLQSAGEARDAKELCDDVLAGSLRDRLAAPGSTCEAELDKALKDADDFGLDVEAVTISGATATARVRGREAGGHRVWTLRLARAGRDWRVTDLGT